MLSALMSRREFAQMFSVVPLLGFGTTRQARAGDYAYDLTLGQRMCLDGKGREIVSPMALGGRIVTIIAGGQSNCSNTAGGYYAPATANLYNLNIGDGNIYRAQEPLLGCDAPNPDAKSNFLTRLGDEILLAALAENVVIVPWAISGVPAWLWAEGGRFHRNVHTVARRVLDAGLAGRSKCICIWQHGETDNFIGTPRHEYARQVISVAETMQRILGPVPFVVAQATIYLGAMSPEIRAAQGDVADLRTHRYVGPDTDSLSDDYFNHRYRDAVDLTHWSAEGAAKVAQLLANSLAPLL
jgi:hypothetical protein